MDNFQDFFCSYPLNEYYAPYLTLTCWCVMGTSDLIQGYSFSQFIARQMGEGRERREGEKENERKGKGEGGEVNITLGAF